MVTWIAEYVHPSWSITISTQNSSNNVLIVSCHLFPWVKYFWMCWKLLPHFWEFMGWPPSLWTVAHDFALWNATYFIRRLFIFTHCIFHLFYCFILYLLLSILYSKWSVNYVHHAYSSISSQINILYWYW